MDSPVDQSMDFSTFVLELGQSPGMSDCTADSPAANNRSRECFPPESRLSQEFERSMQKLISNFDLGDDDFVGVTAAIPAVEGADQNESAAADPALPMDRENLNESLATTIDNEDDPLELTGEELDDSGDAGDGCSSDEQQQSRSLSLSYSLSISHAQENYSQYSQSTDKGLSKRYDSPCSYEDDRESECTNFDKLDDWNDFITDMHNNNNNNNGDNANRDFREYYDEYLAAKGQNGSSTSGVGTSEEGTNDGCNTKESGDEMAGMSGAVDAKPMKRKLRDSRPDTPACSATTSVTEKCRTFLEYRSPADEYDDDPMTAAMMTDDNSNLLVPADEIEPATSVERQPSCGKRKLEQDREDIEYQLSNMYEKFHKTAMVPDHGYHPPLLNDNAFRQLNLVESPSKTPIPSQQQLIPAEDYQTDDEELVRLDGEQEECAVATTPTNPNASAQHLFRSLANDAPIEGHSRQLDEAAAAGGGQRQWQHSKKLAPRQNASQPEAAGPSCVSRVRSSLCLDLNKQQ